MEIFGICYLKKALQPSSLHNNKALKHYPCTLEMMEPSWMILKHIIVTYDHIMQKPRIFLWGLNKVPAGNIGELQIAFTFLLIASILAWVAW